MPHLQVALQAVLNTCQHIATQNLVGSYKENKEVFELLTRKEIISKETGNIFKAAIGVRNIFVNQYEEVKVYEVIQNNLTDFDIFVEEIEEYLKLERIFQGQWAIT